MPRRSIVLASIAAFTTAAAQGATGQTLILAADDIETPVRAAAFGAAGAGRVTLLLLLNELPVESLERSGSIADGTSGATAAARASVGGDATPEPVIDIVSRLEISTFGLFAAHSENDVSPGLHCRSPHVEAVRLTARTVALRAACTGATGETPGEVLHEPWGRKADALPQGPVQLRYRTGSADLPDADARALRELLDALRRLGLEPEALVELCEDGVDNALVSARASSARRALVASGMSAGRVHVMSCGEERPIAPDDDAQAWQVNRRNQIWFLTGTGG